MTLFLTAEKWGFSHISSGSSFLDSPVLKRFLTSYHFLTFPEFEPSLVSQLSDQTCAGICPPPPAIAASSCGGICTAPAGDFAAKAAEICGGKLGIIESAGPPATKALIESRDTPELVIGRPILPEGIGGPPFRNA